MFGTSLPPVACRRVYVIIMQCLFPHSGVNHLVLLRVFTFLFPCCDVRCDFRIKPMFGTSLPPVVCIQVFMTSLCYLCLYAYSCVRYVSTHRQHVGCLMIEKNCLPFARTRAHPRFLIGSVLLIFLIFCVALFCVLIVFVLCLLCPMLPVSLDRPFCISPSVLSAKISTRK